MAQPEVKDLERSLELVRRVALRLESAGDRLVQALKDAGDPRELVYQLRRCEIPNAADLVEAKAALVRAVHHAEQALLADAAKERDTGPGAYARQLAEEVSKP